MQCVSSGKLLRERRVECCDGCVLDRVVFSGVGVVLHVVCGGEPAIVDSFDGLHGLPCRELLRQYGPERGNGVVCGGVVFSGVGVGVFGVRGGEPAAAVGFDILHGVPSG